MAKLAFSVSPEGHEYDAQIYQALSILEAMKADAKHRYSHKAPLKALLTADGDAGILNKLKSRHYNYAAQKHQAGGNAWNPLGGLLTPGPYEGE